MADEANKDAQSAEKAYAQAAGTLPPKQEPEALVTDKADAKPSPEPVTVKSAEKQEKKPAAPTKPAPPPAKKISTKAVPAKPAPAKAKKAKAATPKASKSKAPLKKPLPVKPQTISQLKETIMAKNPDFTSSVTEVMSEMQTRAKAAYDKSAETAGEFSEFAKGNVEAIVESGKIFSEGFQDIGKAYVEEAKSAFETMTADLKEMAAIKSPTDLFQLQGKLMRRNFDSMVAFGSKSSETMIKLANDSMAPISSRMSQAADKISKAASV